SADLGGRPSVLDLTALRCLGHSASSRSKQPQLPGCLGHSASCTANRALPRPLGLIAPASAGAAWLPRPLSTRRSCAAAASA
ncbi:unnamed protein product, partial [Musa acuminata subsp. burmannicoides]